MQVGKLLLGIDIGTQAVKALLVRLDGGIVSQASTERGPSHPNPGWVDRLAKRLSQSRRSRIEGRHPSLKRRG